MSIPLYCVTCGSIQVTCDFFLNVEENTKIEDVVNYDEMLAKVESELRALCDPGKVQAQLGRQAASPSKTDCVQADPYVFSWMATSCFWDYICLIHNVPFPHFFLDSFCRNALARTDLL